MKTLIRLRNKRGFTLVEVIVVLVILAILAAVFIPSLTSYIEKAEKAQIIATARSFYTAFQAALSEEYGQTMLSSAIIRSTESGTGAIPGKVGKTTNWTFNNFRNHANGAEGFYKNRIGNNPDEQKLLDNIDVKMAVQAYKLCDGQEYLYIDKSPSGNEKRNSETERIIFVCTFNEKAQLLRLEFSQNSWLVTISENGLTAEKGAKTVRYSY